VQIFRALFLLGEVMAMNRVTDSDSSMLTLGTSGCLLGEPTRFNGSHKLSRYVRDTLGAHFTLDAVCPEAAIGLGTPRSPVRLIVSDGGVRVVDCKNAELDHTQTLKDFGARLIVNNPHWFGFIGAAKSPSCGVDRVKVYHKGVVVSHADGIVVQAMKVANPWLPIEDEGRLHDAALRENFILRVFVYAAWKQLNAHGITAKNLLDFWSRHKFLVLAHSQRHYREIGPLLADLKIDLRATAHNVFDRIMQALANPATRANHVNVLQHLQGFIKRDLAADDKREWQSIVDNYRDGHVPLSVPMTLLQHYVRRYGDDYVRAQSYLQPYPTEFGLRNVVV